MATLGIAWRAQMHDQALANVPRIGAACHLRPEVPATRILRATIFAGLALVASASHAQSRQWLVTATENKVELRDGVVTVRQAAAPDSLSIFDISSSAAKLVGRVDVPTSVVGPPQSLALAPDLSVAIVTAAARLDPADATKVVDGNQVSVVDLEASPPALVQSLIVGPAPAGVAISSDGKLVLVATRADSAVLVFALEGKRLRQTARIALPDKSVPAGIAIAPDGKRALVTRDGDSTVTVLAIEGNEVRLAGRDFFTGVRPYGVQISRSGEWAIVGNVGRGQGDYDTIALVSMRDGLPRAVHHATAGPSVGGVAISPDSKLVAAVVHDGSNRPASSPFYRANGRVLVFRIDDGKLVPVGSAAIGKWSQGAAFSADSRRLFVENMVEHDVQVLRVDADGLFDTGERISLPGGGAAIAVGYR
jgi:6-phosphogluconolactonase (cycloisomerase 2 family)